MVGVEDQQDVQHAHGLLGDLVRHDRRVEHHVQEVRAVGQVVARIHDRFADALLVGERGHRADRGNQARGRNVDVLLERQQVDVRVEHRQRVDHGGQDVHGVCAARIQVEEVAHVFMQQGVGVQQAGERARLLRARQVAVNQQIRDVYEPQFLVRHKFLNRDPAIAQDAFFAVDICNAAAADRRIHQTGVEREVAGRLAERSDIDRFLALGADYDRQLDVVPVHGQGREFTRHRSASSLMLCWLFAVQDGPKTYKLDNLHLKRTNFKRKSR